MNDPKRCANCNTRYIGANGTCEFCGRDATTGKEITNERQVLPVPEG